MLGRDANGFKPYLPLSINWGHPLAQGLIACVIANNDGPATLVDLVSNTPLTLQGSGTKKSFNFGWGLDCSQANNSGALCNIPGPLINWNVSYGGAIAWGGAFSGITPSADQALFGIGNTTSTEAYIGTGSTPSTNYLTIIGGNFGDATSLVGINNLYRDVLFTWSGGGHGSFLYENGRLIQSGAPSFALSISSSFKLYAGEAPERTTSNSQSFFSYGYIWNRNLSSAQALWLHVDPYAFLTRSSKLWISSSNPASGGSAINFRRTLAQYGTGAGKRQIQWR